MIHLPLIAAALLAAPASAPTQTQALQRSGRAVVGQPAPFFAGWTLDDRVLNRTKILKAEARGHVIVLFATWCKPCEAGLRALEARRADLAARGVKVWLIDVLEETTEIRAFKARLGLRAPIILDRFGRAAESIGGFKAGKGALPRTLVLDAGGVVLGIFGEEGPDYVDRILGLIEPDAGASPTP